MNLFKSKNIERKIDPQNKNFNNIKPRIFEDQIDFDRMRLYRLNRVRKQMELKNIGAVILFLGTYSAANAKKKVTINIII